MKRSTRASIAPLLFPTLIGLAFLLIVPIVSMMQIEANHRRIDNEIDPLHHHARKAIELAYEMHADVLYYLHTLRPEILKDYRGDQREWKALMQKTPSIQKSDAPLADAWRQGIATITDWMQHDVEPNLQSGALEDAVAIRHFRAGVAALNTVTNLAAQREAEQRDGLRRIWQTTLDAEIVGGVVCVLLVLFAWRNARALQNALLAASDGSERLALAVKETNHRVKNNLQTIGALIDMNRQEHRDHVPRHVLDEVYQQVRTVAAVHDFLSHEHLGDRVDTQPLLHRLVELASGPSALQTEVHAVAAVLPVKAATSMALITNELILNAGKHGARCVKVDFCREADTYALRVTDDGPGFPPDFSVAAYSNIGLSLVETLARHDLNGEAHWSNHALTGGAHVEILFPTQS